MLLFQNVMSDKGSLYFIIHIGCVNVNNTKGKTQEWCLFTASMIFESVFMHRCKKAIAVFNIL